MNERGVINNIQRAQQINDFSNLLYGKITPTDIDGMIEYRGKLYIFFEIKYKDKDMPFGQRLALERLVKDLTYANKKAIAIVAMHNVESVYDSVDASACIVKETFVSERQVWTKPPSQMTLKQVVDSYINLLEP